MAEKQARKPAPKLTDEDRHKRFLDVAKEVEASDKPEDFDRAFGRVAKQKPANPPKT